MRTKNWEKKWVFWFLNTSKFGKRKHRKQFWEKNRHIEPVTNEAKRNYSVLE